MNIFDHKDAFTKEVKQTIRKIDKYNNKMNKYNDYGNMGEALSIKISLTAQEISIISDSLHYSSRD